MTRVTGCAILIAIAASGLFGQPQPQSPAFEVASMKPAPPDDGRNMGHVSGGPGTSDPGQFTALNITLRWLLTAAFPEAYRVIGPDWLGRTHYDLVAKVPPGTSKDHSSS